MQKAHARSGNRCRHSLKKWFLANDLHKRHAATGQKEQPMFAYRNTFDLRTRVFAAGIAAVPITRVRVRRGRGDELPEQVGMIADADADADADPAGLPGCGSLNLCNILPGIDAGISTVHADGDPLQVDSCGMIDRL
ncbi:MAG: hypothetical protein HWD60_07045 [Defluviicoccus sp.]|nr:MAG: hypothetical protein HWD60_07045 [Defluviicoccus sp.]